MSRSFETKTALRPCPICRARRVEILHAQRFTLPEGSALPAAYDVVACPGCGFVYADTPVSQTDYDRHYAQFSKYEDPTVATGGGASAADRERLERLAARLAAHVPPSARVLDLGCAGGGLLLVLRERGFRHLHGIDASEACVEQVGIAGFPATCLPLSRLGTFGAGERFDLIVLSHVLEHVVELRPLLDSVRALVASGGVVYAETPDASRYVDHSFVPFYFFDSEHINHFDSERLSALGRASGLAEAEAGEGTLEVAGGRLYPVCWVFLRPGPSSATPDAGAGKRFLRDRVAAYAEGSRVAPGFAGLSHLASSGRPVIVWGAGSFAQRLFGEGAIAGCNVVAVVDRDRNKQGRMFAGLTVESPETALRRYPAAAVVVAAAIHAEAIALEARALFPGVDVVALCETAAGARAVGSATTGP